MLAVCYQHSAGPPLYERLFASIQVKDVFARHTLHFDINTGSFPTIIDELTSNTLSCSIA
jgi:hypothetical protein